jgi:uncharacterized membrane protein
VDSRRAESFSDGVFAVAITVLVFNLLPIGSRGELTYRLLGHAWPQYAAYVISFLTIGIMWLNHHTLLGHVAKVNRPLLVLNLILLMGVVAIPFPTALVADHLTGRAAGDGQASVALVSYGLIMMIISVGYASIWLYLGRHQQALGARRIPPRGLATLRFTAGNAGYVAGTLIAAIGAPIPALIIFGLLAVYYLFEHLPEPSGEPGPDTSEVSGERPGAPPPG